MAFFGSSWFEEDKPVGPFAHWLEDHDEDWDTTQEEKEDEEEQWHQNVCKQCLHKSDCSLYPNNIKHCIKHE